MADYFEHPFADTMVNSAATTSEDDSNSSPSISPTEKVGLTYPQHAYFISTGTACLLNDFDCCTAHGYSSELDTQRIMYSSSEEQHSFLPSQDGFGSTPSTTSTMTSASFHHPFNTNVLPFPVSSKDPTSEEMDYYSGAGGNSHDYDRPLFSYRPSPNESHYSMDIPQMVSHNNRHRDKKSPTGSTGTQYTKDSHYPENQERKSGYAKRHPQTKVRRRCSNCHTPQSPSWRRSISKPTKGNLLCNACGLYEKTAKRKRMLVTQDDGATKVVRKRDVRNFTCSRCGSTDATRWRRTHDSVLCEKCTRGRR